MLNKNNKNKSLENKIILMEKKLSKVKKTFKTNTLLEKKIKYPEKEIRNLSHYKLKTIH